MGRRMECTSVMVMGRRSIRGDGEEEYTSVMVMGRRSIRV